MVKSAIAKLLQQMPITYDAFERTEYPMPVSKAILGEMPNVSAVRKSV
jgi:hypothetical protein